ncbi:MAG: thiamine phosphate synthase [Pyrinomonadaceae bacterium]
MNLRFPPIYPITDIALSGLSIPEQIRRLVAGGATLIQVRAKDASSRELFAAGAEAVRFARENKARIIINDRVDIAMALHADGVHLGQSDLSPLEARKLLGEKAIIGFSTHSLEQAVEASGLPIDYLAFGPIFPTSTKEDPDPVVGLDLLVEVKRAAGGLPIVAIGGIDERNLPSVLAAGADSAAMVAGIMADPDGISERVRSLLRLALERSSVNKII